MAQGEYKSGQSIEVIYQAAGAVSGLSDVKMDVYDEGHLVDVGKGVAAMTEIASTGRYYATFTPDAEGEWTVQIDSITKPGKIVKKYSVVGHNVDSVGDAIAGQNDISAAQVATELSTYDAPTKAEMDAKIDAQNDISAVQVAAELETYDAVKKSELDSSETAIRGSDGDTLKTISEQIDNVASADSAPIIG